MISVSYAEAIPYGRDFRGDPAPIIPVRLSSPSAPGLFVDVRAHLDSGAERSLFDGELLVAALRIELLAGNPINFQTTTGRPFAARLHTIRIFGPFFGGIDLEVGVSTVPIRRNLLGRDFFNRVQIGFRENQSMLYLTGSP